MITLRIEEILRERGITKTQFAEMMGVAKQNVNLLLNTNNTQMLSASVLQLLPLSFGWRTGAFPDGCFQESCPY